MTIIKSRNRQRVLLLYVSLAVVAAVIVVTNNHSNNRYGRNHHHDGSVDDAIEASAAATTSDDQGDDFQRLPLHLNNNHQHHQRRQEGESLHQEFLVNNGGAIDDRRRILHSESDTPNNKKRQLSRHSNRGRHDSHNHGGGDDDELLRHQRRQDLLHQDDTAIARLLAPREKEEDDLILMTSSSSPLLHGESAVNENRVTSKQQQSSSSRRHLNRGGPEKHDDVMEAIEKDRLELEQILGHPIYHQAKSSKTTTAASADDGEEVKWTAAASGGGDLWTAGGSSSTKDPWTASGDSDWSSTTNNPVVDSSSSHHHTILPTETGWNDDGWDNHSHPQSHYKPDLDNLRSDLIQLIDETERELLPKCLRLAFHDCIGGCNGCIDPTVIDNRGLEEPVELLFPLVQKYQHLFSRADVWAYCAVVAADMAVVENRPQELQFYMHYLGRTDCDGADDKGFGGPQVEMYTNHMTTHEMIQFFDQRFGLNPYEMVVLMGVHSAAVAARNNTGFGNRGREDGWIHDAEEYKLSNMYYTSMLSSVWEMEKVENDGPVPDRYQWYFDPDGHGPIMTTSDMSLIIDPEGFIINDSSGGEGLVMCRAHEEAEFEVVDNIIDEQHHHDVDVPVCPMAEQTRGIVQELEQDNTQFLFAFVSVLNKMITNGYDIMHSSPVVVASSSSSSSKSGKMSGDGKSGKGSKRAASTPTWMPSWWGAATKTNQPVAPPSAPPTAPPTRVADPTGAPNKFPSPSGVPSAEPTFMPSNHPSEAPSVMPSTQPSEVPSTRPSVFPSSNPSFMPSSNPTVLPSIAPSTEPSSEPSLLPSISSKPTQEYLPSSSPTISMKPTSKPSSIPTTSPSFPPSIKSSSTPSKSPTTNPTAGPTKPIRDDQPTSSPISSAPVEFLTRRPTWSPTISLWPTKAPTTKRPTWAPTISLWPTRAPNTSRPTFAPTPLATDMPSLSVSPTAAPTVSPTSASPTQQPTTAIPTEEPTKSRSPTFPPSGLPSSSPTVSSKPTEEDTTKSPTLSPTTSPPSPSPSISQLPTTGRKFAPRLNQQMDLFGLEILEQPGTILFTRNTKRYIEWFFNDYEGPREGIRGQVFNVRAIIRTTGTVEGIGVERKRKKIYLGGNGKFVSSDKRPTDEDSVHWELMSSPSEQRFGEFHSASNGLQRQLGENGQDDDRKLQGLGEFCFGRFTGVRYTLELAYSLSNSDITPEDIASEPFSTSEYRDIYMNDWLKADDPIGAFDSVRCTGSPRLFTAEPSVAPSVAISATPSATPSATTAAPVS